MSTKNNQNNNQVVDRIHTLLERNLIEAYLNGKGYTLNELKHLPKEMARSLMSEASTYASCKLAEIDLRAHLMTTLHDAYINE
jgi:hypothetical protein